jgi:hypothetical protein
MKFQLNPFRYRQHNCVGQDTEEKEDLEEGAEDEEKEVNTMQKEGA